MTDYSNIVNDLLGISDTLFAIGTSNKSIEKISIRMAFDKNWHNIAKHAADAIEALQAQLPKRGEWIIKPHGTYGQLRAFCSACGKHSGIGGIVSNQKKPYCPNCGAKMEAKG